MSVTVVEGIVKPSLPSLLVIKTCLSVLLTANPRVHAGPPGCFLTTPLWSSKDTPSEPQGWLSGTEVALLSPSPGLHILFAGRRCVAGQCGGWA